MLTARLGRVRRIDAAGRPFARLTALERMGVRARDGRRFVFVATDERSLRHSVPQPTGDVIHASGSGCARDEPERDSSRTEREDGPAPPPREPARGAVSPFPMRGHRREKALAPARVDGSTIIGNTAKLLLDKAIGVTIGKQRHEARLIGAGCATSPLRVYTLGAGKFAAREGPKSAASPTRRRMRSSARSWREYTAAGDRPIAAAISRIE